MVGNLAAVKVAEGGLSDHLKPDKKRQLVPLSDEAPYSATFVPL